MSRIARLYLWSPLIICLLFLPGFAQDARSVQHKTSAVDLATALISATTDEGRSRLIDANKELLTAQLWRELIKQGNTIERHGDYPAAISVYQVTQSVAERMTDQAGVAAAIRNFGNVYLNKGDTGTALKYYQQSLSISERANDKEGIASTLSNFGNVYSARGEMSQALENHERSLRMSQELGDYYRIVTAYNNIGVLHGMQGDYDAALGDFQKVLEISREQRDKTQQGPIAMDDRALAALMNLGNIYRHYGNYLRALEYYQQALALNEKVGNKVVMGRLLNNIGNVYKQQNDYQLGLEYYRKGRALKEASGDKRGIATALVNMGDTARLLGDYPQALDYLQKGVALFEELKSKEGPTEALGDIGLTYYAQGKVEQALDYFQRGLAISDSLGLKAESANHLDNLARVYHEKGDDAKAAGYAERAVQLARSIRESEVLWLALTMAGKIQLGLHHHLEARKDFEEAIATAEALRSNVAGGEQEEQASFSDKVAPYHEMVALLVAEHKDSEALAYAERARARVLLDVLRGGRVSITKAMTNKEQEQERSLNSELVALNAQSMREASRPNADAARLADLKARLQKARLAREEFQTGLYGAHPELKIKRGEVQPLRPEESAELLPDTRSVLIEYVVTAEKTYMFVLTRNDHAEQQKVNLRVYELAIKQQALALRADAFRQRLASRDLRFREPARELYDLLLKPAREQLQAKTTLIIVPDGTLWQLPFQALQSALNHYLLEDYAVSYAPSLTVLREMQKPRKEEHRDTAPSFLAVGNPTVGKQTIEHLKFARRDESLAPLPEAEQEVQTLGQMYGAAQSRVYVGSEAREERIKAEAGKFDVLHLATHGILDDSNPMYSHLVLSQTDASTSEDGLLEAWEIMNLDLKARLVVLSACETARGKVTPGEGVIGMVWAIFVAGCPTTVVSQWKVDSAGTAALMLEFHRNLQPQTKRPDSRLSTSRALQQASLKMLRSDQYKHPFYWASFVVVGDGR